MMSFPIRSLVSVQRYLLFILIGLLTACGSSSGGSSSDTPKNTITNITLEFERNESQEAVLGQPFSNPLKAYPEGLTINYSSSNADIASINTSGDVTLKKPGIVHILATSPGNETYNVTEASYLLEVKPAPIEDVRCQSNSEATTVNIYSNVYDYEIQGENCVGIENEKLSVKKIPVSIELPSSDFIFSDDVIVSQSENSNHIYYTLGIQNVSDTDYCFIRISGIRILDESGIDLIDDDVNFDYVEGTLFYHPSLEFSSRTCLKSNQEGIFSGIENVGSIESVASFEIGSIEVSDVFDEELPSLTSQNYNWNFDDSTIYLSYENTSSRKIENGFSKIYYLNDNNEIIHWSFLNDSNSNVDVGDDMEVYSQLSDYKGFSSKRFIVSLDYDPVLESSASVYKRTLQVDRDLRAVDIHKYHADLEKIKLQIEESKLNKLKLESNESSK